MASVRFLLAAVLIAGPLPAQQPARIDAAANARAVARELIAKERIPGISLAVGVNGRIAFSEAFGFYDLENRAPVSTNTRMRIGSVSKSVTSIALGQLVENGRLDLDAEVQKYVPSFPRKPWPVTVRQVAGHIAGIRHYKGNENLINTHYPNVTAALDIFKDDSLLFEPGTKYSYSSYGWNLLSAVIEGASGEQFLSYMRGHVFTPLGLQSIVAEQVDSIIPFHSRFYEMTVDSVMRNAPFVDNSYKWAGGGFISNTEDLVTIAYALIRNNFLKPSTVSLLFTPQTLKSGAPTTYGMGWSSGRDDKGRAMVWHTGGSVGGRAVLLIYPDQGVVVAMLANAGHAPMSVANARRIAEPFLQ